MLTGKQIACSGATYFCQTLNDNSLASNVISLRLNGNLLKHHGLNTLIGDFLSTPAAANLRGLDLSDNLLERECVQPLARYLASAHCQLETLLLSSNELGAHVATVMPSIRTRAQGGMLCALDLSDVNLGDDGALAISECIISSAMTLRSLNVDHNAVTDTGGGMLVRVIIRDYRGALLYLSLANNKLTNSTAAKYLDGIIASEGNNGGTCFLELKGNLIDESLIKSIGLHRKLAKVTGARRATKLPEVTADVSGL